MSQTTVVHILDILREQPVFVEDFCDSHCLFPLCVMFVYCLISEWELYAQCGVLSHSQNGAKFYSLPCKQPQRHRSQFIHSKITTE